MVLKIQTESGGKRNPPRVMFDPVLIPHPTPCRRSWSGLSLTLISCKPIYTLSASDAVWKAKVTCSLGIADINRIFLFFYINPVMQAALCPRDNVNWLERHCNALYRKITGQSSLIHNGKKQTMVVSTARILWQQRPHWQMEHNCCLLSDILE